MKTLKAGQLREIISVARPLRVSNDSGGMETTYSSYLNTFAAVTEEASNTQLIQGQENITQVVKFCVRYRPTIEETISNGDRLVWRGFNFTVNNMQVDHLRRFITIRATSEIETSER